MENAIYTATLTLAGAIILYLIKDLYEHFFSKPRNEYIDLRSEIAYALVFYHYKYRNPARNYVAVNQNDIDEREFASKEFRGLAAKIHAFADKTQLRIRAFYCCDMPSSEDFRIVARALVGLANGITSKEVEFNKGCEKQIREVLKITEIF